MEARKCIPCPYFLKGECRYGDTCQLRHDEADRNGADGSAMVGKGGNGNSSSAMGTSGRATGELACGICLEDPVVSGRRFGLLGCCDHPFCLDCLRKWRGTKGVDADVSRSCPTCRKKSAYVVPSAKFCIGEEKDKVVAAYLDNVARKPCRKFDGIRGSCPFGRDCYFAHLNSDGEDIKADDVPSRVGRERRGRGGRGPADGDGGSDVDFINAFLFMLSLVGDGVSSDSDQDDAWTLNAQYAEEAVDDNDTYNDNNYDDGESGSESEGHSGSYRALVDDDFGSLSEH